MAKGEKHSIELQPRDWELLRGLFESRVMTQKHISALYFAGKSEMTKKRLQRLKAAGLIRERPRRHASEPAVLFLARPAFRLLKDEGKLSDYPKIGIEDLEKRVQVSDLKLRHELEVMDVKAAMVTAVAKTSHLSIAEFSTWPELYQFESCDPTGKLVETQPDGFVRIHERLGDGGVQEHSFFIEVDRSKEGNPVLADRAHCYGTFYRDGGLAVRNGRPREKYKQFFFRVLITCKTAEKRNNLAAKMLLNTPPVHSQVWLSTIDEIRLDPIGTIWIRPVDYRNITANTPFDPYVQQTSRVYRRQTERDEFINSRGIKLQLF